MHFQNIQLLKALHVPAHGICGNQDHGSTEWRLPRHSISHSWKKHNSLSKVLVLSVKLKKKEKKKIVGLTVPFHFIADETLLIKISTDFCYGNPDVHIPWVKDL